MKDYSTREIAITAPNCRAARTSRRQVAFEDPKSCSQRAHTIEAIISPATSATFSFCGLNENTCKRRHRRTLWFGRVRRSEATAPLCRWFDVGFPEQGKISVIDVRGVDDSAAIHVRDELKYRAADIIFFIRDSRLAPELEKRELADLNGYLSWNETLETDRKIIEIIVLPFEKVASRDHKDVGATRDEHVVGSSLVKRGIFLETLRLIPVDHDQGFELAPAEARRLMSILARELPNEARMEMIRISRDREAQREVAQLLIKSTTAVCTAIGAQPIPLADLPILTSLQLMMVSGVMYVSGRERSLRAAAEFAGALGANVGAAMLLREGARAILKFFPGWGNVVCGLVAGSGTYAIGRAATAFFIEGVSLKDARRTYLASRKKRRRREFEEAQ